MRSSQSTVSWLHRPRIDEEHVYHARLPPGGVQGSFPTPAASRVALSCSHTPALLLHAAWSAAAAI